MNFSGGDYVGLGGHIYADLAIKSLKGATNAKWYDAINRLFKGATDGIGGVTKNDVKQIKKVIEAYGEEFDLDVSKVLADMDWDFKKGRLDGNFTTNQNWKALSPKALTGSTTGRLEGKNTTEATGPQPNTNTNTNTSTPSTNTNTNTSNTATSTPSTSTSTSTTTSSSKPATSSSSSNVDYYEDRISKLENENKEYKAKIDELSKEPEVMSADAAAKHFNINNNLEDILNDYNTRTKEYYDSAINTQDNLRTSYARNNTQYYDNLLDSYMESYKYAAPTAVGKGALAANALTNQLNAGNAIAANDYGMMQSVENLKEAKLAELANNPLLAEQYRNNINTYLSTLTANNHLSDVKQRVAELDSYSDRYASVREEQASLANAASTKYAGLANANTYNNSNSGNQVNKFEQMLNYYTQQMGNETDARKYINNLLGTSGGKTQNVGV